MDPNEQNLYTLSIYNSIKSDLYISMYVINDSLKTNNLLTCFNMFTPSATIANPTFIYRRKV